MIADTQAKKKTPHAPARARLPLLRFRPGGVGLDGATWGAGNKCSGSDWKVCGKGARRDPLRYFVAVVPAEPFEGTHDASGEFA